MRKIYKFYWNCRRQGDLEGLFTADESEVNSIIGKDIYFGEVLGKHSEVTGKLEAEDLQVKCKDQAFIAKFEKIFGSGTIFGFNPLDYAWEDER